MTGNGLVVVDRPKIFSAFPEIVAGVSTREGGVSGPVLGLNLSFRVGDDPENVRENRRRFFGAFGMTESDAAIPQQVHSRRIVEAPSAGPYESCDGVFTDRTGMGLVVTVADCVPILLYDPKTESKAAVHAGWRGSEACIVQDAVARIAMRFGARPGDIHAYIGHAAGICCYEVGRDVAMKFLPEVREERGGRMYLDLKAENRRQLEAGGVPASQIEICRRCTICDTALHSHRRDGSSSGRMMALIAGRD